jgi:hypothetical protein
MSYHTTTMTEHATKQVERANASGLTPVVFVHGLWLLPSSWDRWAELSETAGCVALTPGWPMIRRPSARPAPIPRCSRANQSARWRTASAK